MDRSEKLANAAKGLGDSALGKGVGHGVGQLGTGLTLLGLAAFVGAIGFFAKWDGHLHEQKECYELQETKGKVIKLNTCTGEIEEISIGPTE